METRLREWRQEAVNKHQYETAICVGDKLLAMTGASHPSNIQQGIDFIPCLPCRYILHAAAAADR